MGDLSVADHKRRLSKHERRAQLLGVAKELIRDAGTDEFTLGRLAERAGVTKPLVYDHFGDRAGALAELYREFEARQRDALAAALKAAPVDVQAVADVVAKAYIDCCLAEGGELSDIISALAGSPALSQMRQEAEDAYLARCREALEPLAGPMDNAALHAIIGAGEALVRNVVAERISPTRARETLSRVICAVATQGSAADAS